MKMHFVENKTEGDSQEQLEALKERFSLSEPETADFIYCASIRSMGWAEVVRGTKPLVVYCWDYYTWAHEGKHPGEGNWVKYANFLKSADLVIVPSRAQQRLLKELLDLDSHVVRTGIKKREGPVSDNNFILDPVRYYPEENMKWAEEAAKDLGIPLIHSEHSYSAEEFDELIRTCTFMICAYRQASTGGLTLAEGLWLGKPSLVSDSPYMGAVDYLGEYGTYFQFDDFEDLRANMLTLWELRPQVDPIGWYKNELSFARMANEIYTLCEHILK